MQHNAPVNGNPHRRWVIRSEVDSFTFGGFAKCMADIAESVKLINEQCSQGQFKMKVICRMPSLTYHPRASATF